jgi:D-3-phosphoglycerate dehydrogenase
VLDDYQDAFRTLSCFARLAGHEVQVFHNTVKEPAGLCCRDQGSGCTAPIPGPDYTMRT